MSAETAPKKVFGMPHNVGVGVLCVLGAVCLYEFYSNVLAGPGIPTPDPARNTAATASAPPTIAMPGSGPETATRRALSTQRRGEEFNPSLHPKRPEDRLDPAKIDPTIRFDLLAKVQAVEPSVGGRNLFQMGAPPSKTVETAALTGKEPVVKPIGPAPPPPKVETPPPAPPPPTPIPLKFYGFTTLKSTGKKSAYFMDGDDILIAGEGETLKRRYKVVQINTTSVTMEDTESGNKRQTLPLTEETQG